MNTYTVTLTAAQGGRNPHAFRGIEADSAADAVVLAYRERHPHATATRRDVHARGNDISDTRFSIFGNAGAVTFADVEVVEPPAPVEAVDESAPRCQACADHPGWAHADQTRRSEPRDVCRECMGSGTPQVRTVSTDKVWRCAGRSGSMYAKRDAFGFVEVFQRDIDDERAAGTHLFRITA